MVAESVGVNQALAHSISTKNCGEAAEHWTAILRVLRVLAELIEASWIAAAGTLAGRGR